MEGVASGVIWWKKFQEKVYFLSLEWKRAVTYSDRVICRLQRHGRASLKTESGREMK